MHDVGRSDNVQRQVDCLQANMDVEEEAWVMSLDMGVA
jgi:hypothetical protein